MGLAGSMPAAAERFPVLLCDSLLGGTRGAAMAAVGSGTPVVGGGCSSFEYEPPVEATTVAVGTEAAPGAATGGGGYLDFMRDSSLEVTTWALAVLGAGCSSEGNSMSISLLCPVMPRISCKERPLLPSIEQRCTSGVSALGLCAKESHD